MPFDVPPGVRIFFELEPRESPFRPRPAATRRARREDVEHLLADAALGERVDRLVVGHQEGQREQVEAL